MAGMSMMVAFETVRSVENKPNQQNNWSYSIQVFVMERVERNGSYLSSKQTDHVRLRAMLMIPASFFSNWSLDSSSMVP